MNLELSLIHRKSNIYPLARFFEVLLAYLHPLWPLTFFTELSYVLGDLLCLLCEMTLEYVHESVICIFLGDASYRLESQRTHAHVDFHFFICHQLHLVIHG